MLSLLKLFRIRGNLPQLRLNVEPKKMRAFAGIVSKMTDQLVLDEKARTPPEKVVVAKKVDNEPLVQNQVVEEIMQMANVEQKEYVPLRLSDCSF